MKGYVIADVDVQDPDAYADYRKGVLATVEAYGGRFLVRGGEVEALEGDWAPGRIVVLEFESPERARAWYDSDEYRDLKALRRAASSGKLLLVAGAD